MISLLSKLPLRAWWWWSILAFVALCGLFLYYGQAPLLAELTKLVCSGLGGMGIEKLLASTRHSNAVPRGRRKPRRR